MQTQRSSSVQLQRWIRDEPGSWSLIKDWLRDELLDCYKKLANPLTTSVMTEQERGRAAFISKLLGLDNMPVGSLDPQE